MNQPHIGAHVSVAGGPHTAFANAAAIGAESIQIFGASPRQWQVKIPAAEECEKFTIAWRKSDVGNIYLHAAYLPNLASADPAVRARSSANLAAHLNIAAALGAAGLIFHLGSGGAELPRATAIASIAAEMKKILAAVSGKTFLIMENSAGGGQRVGSTIEELALIFKKVHSPRVKICVDTAHALESGILERYDAESVKKVCDQFEKEIGLDELAVIHANDSKTPYNSHHDRHENIGAGHIGMAGFRALAQEKRLWSADWILETPGFDGNGPDEKNIQLLKSCFA